MSRMTAGRSDDGRLTAPAAERNKDTILEVLKRFLPDSGLVLEIASGTGQHVAHFATALPALTWQPTDLDPEHLISIAAWRRHSGLQNVRPPLELDEPISAEIFRTKKKIFGSGTYSPKGTRWTLRYGRPASPRSVRSRATL